MSLGCVRLQSGAAVLNVMDAGEAAVKQLGLAAGVEEEKAGGLQEEEEEDEEGERSESEPDEAEVSPMPGMAEAANIALAEALPNTDDGGAPFAGRFTPAVPLTQTHCASARTFTQTRPDQTNNDDIWVCFGS